MLDDARLNACCRYLCSKAHTWKVCAFFPAYGLRGFALRALAFGSGFALRDAERPAEALLTASGRLALPRCVLRLCGPLRPSPGLSGPAHGLLCGVSRRNRL